MSGSSIFTCQMVMICAIDTVVLAPLVAPGATFRRFETRVYLIMSNAISVLFRILAMHSSAVLINYRSIYVIQSGPT